MNGYNSLKDSYILQVNNDVVSKETANSVDTGDVGTIGIALATLLTDFIAAINSFSFFTGTANPTGAIGSLEGDIYVQTNDGVSLIFWRRGVSAWFEQCTIPLGISHPDGVVSGLRTQIDTASLSTEVAKGAWAISNVVYTKTTSTGLSYDAQPIGVSRIDLIYANSLGSIQILTGASSSSPVKPTLPVNTVEVDSIYIPADGTGLPYLFSGSGNSSSGVGKTIINKTGADVSDYSLDLSVETLPSDAIVAVYINGKTANAPFTYDETTKLIEGLPGTSSGDAIKIIFI